MDKNITILIADDHPLTRAGLRVTLEQAPDMEIIGEAEDGDEAQKLVGELRPDVLLLDLKMPGLVAAKLENWVRANYPEIVTLILTAHDHDAYLAGVIEAGVEGFFNKNERAEIFIAAIRRAVRGECLLTDEQFERARRWNETVGKKWESLTEREREISKLLVQGLSDAALAKTLEIAPRTSSTHVSNLLKKLGLASRQEAVAWLLKYIPEMSDNL
jgi:DNA-binding NarL/FixJ family response regulator